MVKKSSVLIGKSVRVASRLKGGGSALPGLAVEKLDKDFLKEALGKLPNGVVVISGTNGKTTTSKIVSELLESQGHKVFTNSTGSNFKRGVISSLLSQMSLSGRLDADIAVLELDEAHAMHFIKEVKPRYSLLLNVMRDQLDRFGEIDTTASLLKNIAISTTRTVILNREDSRVRAIAGELEGKKVQFFGHSKMLSYHFPSDDQLYAKAHQKEDSLPQAKVVLNKFEGQQAEFEIDGEAVKADLKINGIYNILNTAAAVCLVAEIVGENLDMNKLISRLEKVRPAFGRGEKLYINGQPLEIVLVKNPVSFRLGLESFQPKDTNNMIVINDNYADGRDMSWLWDVNFESLKPKVEMVSGSRAYDMALRLKYDEVLSGQVETDLQKAVDEFVKKAGPKRIFCTYTAMLRLRKILKKYAEVERVL